jgi:transposase InsO family protein
MKKKDIKEQNTDLSDEELRRTALELYEQKWKVSDICSNLGCSRSWFYKWLNRYRTKDDTWFQSEPRAPKTVHRSLDPHMEQLIIDTRKQLMASRFSQYGPQAIYYTLAQQGISPPPVWSIARVLNRHQLTRKRKRGAYIPKGKKYPYEYALCHQMDYVGPRYLSCKSRYYFLTLIDSATHWAQTNVSENQTATSACQSIIRLWKTIGIPDFLQMDNDLAFWGSLRHPGAVGTLIRLCLSLGVTPVFIPLSEPWRNGIIERFNSTMQTHLLKTKYANLDELRQAAILFDEIHNHTHHYSTQNGMTPRAAVRRLQYPLHVLDESFTLPNKPLPLESGEIHLIRFVRSDRKFTVFGLSFPLPEKAQY